MTEQTGTQVPPEIPDALSAYWDQRVTGGAPDAADVSEGLSALVDRLHASDSAPALLPKQRTQIWKDIVAARAMDTKPQNTIAPHVPGANGSVAGLPLPLSTTTAPRARCGRRPGWPVAQLATAALLLLTVVASFLIFSSGRLDRQGLAPRPL